LNREGFLAGLIIRDVIVIDHLGIAHFRTMLLSWQSAHEFPEAVLNNSEKL
jgi:hypothetical protein